MKQPTIWEQLQSGPIVYYDAIPDDARQELQELQEARQVVVEEDVDRVGWSKTGKVYRVTKAQP